MSVQSVFEETNIGRMSLKNHFVRAPTWEGMADEAGHLTVRLLSVYESLARGEVGLIITGFASVLEEDQSSPRMMGVYDDSFIDEYRTLTETVHMYGSKIALQIAYGGSQTFNNPEGRLIWAPSPVRHPHTGVIPAQITEEEIGYLVERYGEAAQRAKRSGFDAVEIHAAAGYFISQFLSPHFNRRIDRYGGSLMNRARILFEVYNKIRSTVGRRYPVLVKINCQDFIENGLTFGDSRWICKELSRRGADAIEISGGLVYDKNLNPARYHIKNQEEEAYFAPYAAQIAEDIAIPVILDGGLRSFEVIERLFLETRIAFFALSRPLIAEPDLIARWRKGDHGRARCISCGKCVNTDGFIECILEKQQSPD